MGSRPADRQQSFDLAFDVKILIEVAVIFLTTQEGASQHDY